MSTYSEFASNLAQLTQAGANAQARGIEQRGQIWGQAIGNLGQIAAQIPAQYHQQKIVDVLKAHNGDVDAALPEIMQIDPGLGSSLSQRLMEAKKIAYEFQIKKWEHDKAGLDFARNLVGSATDPETYAQALYTAKLVGADTSAFPASYDPKFIESTNRSLMTAQQRFEESKPKPPVQLAPGGKLIKPETGETIAENPYQLTPNEQMTQDRLARDAVMREANINADNARQAATATETARHNRAMENRPVASATAAAGSVDPAEKDYWVQQVKNDPTQWNMLSNNKPLQQAVQAGLAKTGTDLNKLSAQSRQMSETAKEILPHISTIQAEAKQIEDAGLMGPVAGRFRDFVAGNGAKYFVGTPNARLIGKFETDLGLLMTAVARAHGGARGGGSPAMLEHMKSIMDAQGKDFSTFLGNLDATKEWMSSYAGMVPTGGPAPAAKDPLGIR